MVPVNDSDARVIRVVKKWNIELRGSLDCASDLFNMCGPEAAVADSVDNFIGEFKRLDFLRRCRGKSRQQ